MKKLVLIFISIFLITGCGGDKWKDTIQFSELKIEDNDIVGDIKNLTDKMYDVTIEFEFKNGDLVETELCSMYLEPNDKTELDCYILNTDSKYEVKVIDVVYEEIPTFEDKDFKIGDKLSEEDIKIYFNKALDTHTLFMITLLLDLEDKLVSEVDLEYPFLDNVILFEDEIIKSTLFFEANNSNIFLGEDINHITGDYKFIYISIYGDNIEDTTNKIISSLSLNSALNVYTPSYLNLSDYLEENTEEGKCYELGKYCYSIERTDTKNTITVGINSDF